jgi:hypothetical protein
VLRLPTEEVIRLTGLSRPTVQQLRRDLGIEPPVTPDVWAPAVLRLLGKVPDAKIAVRVGRSRSAVALKRHQLGIRFFDGRRWAEREDEWLRQLPIEEVVRRTRRPCEAVHRRRRLLEARGLW